MYKEDSSYYYFQKNLSCRYVVRNSAGGSGLINSFVRRSSKNICEILGRDKLRAGNDNISLTNKITKLQPISKVLIVVEDELQLQNQRKDKLSSFEVEIETDGQQGTQALKMIVV